MNLSLQPTNISVFMWIQTNRGPRIAHCKTTVGESGVK